MPDGNGKPKKLKPASAQNQIGGSNYKPGTVHGKNYMGTRFIEDKSGSSATPRKSSSSPRETRKIKNIMDTTDSQGRPVSKDYKYELEKKYQRNRSDK